VTVGQPDSPIEVERLADIRVGSTDLPQPGDPTGFTCPECHGGLWETVEGAVLRFRCRTGHEFSLDSLVVEQSEYVERALWASLRALEEKSAMLRKISTRAAERGHDATARRLERRAEAVVGDAVVIRRLVDRLEPLDQVMIDGDSERA
jgi:two-component system chemotaxis response regulator CheB